MIKVKFFTLLRLYLGLDDIDIDIDGKTIEIGDLLNRIGEKLESRLVHDKLLDPGGEVLQGTIILIDGHDIMHMEGLHTVVAKGQSVSLFPPGGGG